jgi:hypothetical protein
VATPYFFFLWTASAPTEAFFLRAASVLSARSRPLFLGDVMAQRPPPWWWQSEVLARIAMALSAALTAGYLARLLTLFVWSGLMH